MSSKHTQNSTLMILIDAFSKTYFSNKYTPFLHDLSRNGFVTDIEPLFAFKGIETTIFTGVWPNVHNVWTQFCLADSQIGGKRDGLIRKLTRKAADLLPNDETKAKLNYAIDRYIFQNSQATLNLIPTAAMRYFEPSQRREITELEAVDNAKTVFDVFRRSAMKFIFVEPWIRGDRGVLSKAKQLIKHNHRFHFWYLKFNNLDHLGHKFGPTPTAFKEQLMKIDRYIEEIITLLLKRTAKLKVMVLTDHGMSTVYKTVNMIKDLSNLEPRIYQDYLAFLDSTMVRFWFFTKRAKRAITEYLQQFSFGHLLTATEKKCLKIPVDPKYGEATFVLDEGYIIHPCFFHSKSIVKGMHGYAYPKSCEAIPILIMNEEMAGSLRLSKRVNYTDITQLILRSVIPNSRKPTRLSTSSKST